MDIIHADTVIPYSETTVMLGDFDGLHIAHAKLIKSGVEYAVKNGLKSGVLLFEENSKSVLNNCAIKLLTSFGDKLELIRSMGVDFVYIVKFDREFMSKTPEEFIEFLIFKLKIKAVLAGYNYKFGINASGDAEELLQFGKKYGFNSIIMPEMKIDGITVSSSYIRKIVEEGKMDEASKFLGRSFSVSGKVEAGFQNGRKMGFPTANIAYDRNMVLPRSGVYAGITYIGDKYFNSVINIGNNPTFNSDRITVESHMMDFKGDIYGENVKIDFIKRIRGDIKFHSMEELKNQIEKDIKTAENILI